MVQIKGVVVMQEEEDVSVYVQKAEDQAAVLKTKGKNEI